MDEVHVSVDVPVPPVTELGFTAHARFVELVATASVTEPLKPSRGVTVMDGVPSAVLSTGTLVWLAVTV
jgi:hypothetical protein